MATVLHNRSRREIEDLRVLVEAKRALPAPQLRRALRQSADLSLQEIADVVGVARTTVSRWERGLRRPRAEAMSSYREVLCMLAEEGALAAPEGHAERLQTAAPSQGDSHQ